MPTTRPRHFITESDELSAALDHAADRWPGLSRAQLLVRLAIDADRAASEQAQTRRERRLEAIHRGAGVVSGMYPPDYLEELRKDWPD